MPANIEYTKIYLVPEIMNVNIPGLPFSKEFYAQVLSNAYNRKDHQTLDNTDMPKNFSINLMFLKMNKNICLNDRMREQNNFNAFLRLPMTNEKIDVPDEFSDVLIEAIQ